MNPLHHAMKPWSILLSAFAFTSAVLLAAEPAPRLPLPVSAAHVHAQDARMETKTGGALRITTGIAKPWPGVTISLPDEVRDLSRFHRVALDVSNGGDAPVTVHCRVDNPGADGTKHCATGQVTVAPGRTETLGVSLHRYQPGKLDGKLFGMRGYPVAPPGGDLLDPSRVTQLVVFVTKPTAAQIFEIRDLRAEGTHIPPTASVRDADPFFPFIDTFGQYRHRDWPGKVRSLDDLRQRRESEACELDSQPGPAEWSRTFHDVPTEISNRRGHRRFPRPAAPVRQLVGRGCGSLTFQMPSRFQFADRPSGGVSLFAPASMCGSLRQFFATRASG